MSDRHHHTGREDEGDSDWLRSALSTINRKLDTIMTTLADISAAVAAEQTVQASVITLLETLSADLTAALASGDQTAMEALRGATAKMPPPTPLLPGRPTRQAKSPEAS